MSDVAPGGEIRDVDFADALGERYLSYALSTIMARSLPDVRDGLKPVHRRILHAMHELRLDPGSGYKKCARVVGDVIGKFHPHGELAVYDALVRLAQAFAQPKCSTAELIAHLPGPDFPTGGILVEAPESIAEAYATGRGSFRLRARWDKEQLSHGLYQIVVTEIPYQVQKGRLIEKVAALLEERKLPLLADIRDESTAEIRLVLEPKNRNVDADVLMEQLFRLTELETRVPLNLNVVDAVGVPRVMNLKEALQAFLDHRREVLQRRSRYRLAAVARRTEILRGFIVVYVNLDEIIHIIRRADDPKAEIMKRWDLTEVQADAILNMRLRTLHRLEEVAITKEMANLGAESAELEKLLGSERRQWTALAKEVAA